MKKLTALFMALVMMMAMATTASAADTGTITVDNAQSGATYEIYRVFDLEYNTTTGAYRYKLRTDAGWPTVYAAPGFNGYFTVDGGYVTKVVNEAAAAVWLKENLGSISADTTVIPASDMPYGYYLLTTTHGSKQALGTLVPSAVGDAAELALREKNKEIPTIAKEVQEDSPDAWGTSNDAEIGEEINFQIIIEADEGDNDYRVTDTMAAELDFIKITGVTLNGVALDPSKYSVTGTAGDHTFKVDFTGIVFNAYDKIVISYTAKLNIDAASNTAYVNSATLEYDVSKSITSGSTTTKTWEIPLLKVDESGNKLAAGFKVKNSATDKYATFDSNGKLTGWVETLDAATELMTDGTTGKVAFIGFDSGEYVLIETNVPTGYVKAADRNVTIDKANADEQEIVNKTGALLPETGGMGTTIFYMSGIVLMLAGAVVLTKKRRNA